MTKAEQAARTCRHFGISRQAYYRDVWKDQISDRYNYVPENDHDRRPDGA